MVMACKTIQQMKSSAFMQSSCYHETTFATTGMVNLEKKS